MSRPWIITCNIHHFDVASHFKSDKDVVWRKIGNIQDGDIVYIYLANPVKAIRYKTEVVDPDVKESMVREMFPYALPAEEPLRGRLKFMKLHVLKELPPDALTYSALQKAGLHQIRRQCRISDTVMALINSYEQEGGNING